MLRRFASQFRAELDRADVVTAGAFAVALALSGHESTAIGIAAGLLVGVPFVTAVLETTGTEIGPGLAGVALGTLIAAAGVAVRLNGDVWVGRGLVAVGAWVLLDGIDRRRRGDIADDPSGDDVSSTEVFRYGEYNRWVIEELRAADRPLTADEIRSRTGLTADDFERLLEIHGESGPIDRVGDGYVLDESELGAVAFARTLVRTIGGRLRRPFRLFRPAG